MRRKVTGPRRHETRHDSRRYATCTRGGLEARSSECQPHCAIQLMPPIESRPSRFVDRGSVAVLVVAICLSVAGLGGAFLLRQQSEREAQRHGRTAEPARSPFAPSVRALEAVSKIAEPRSPIWAANGGGQPGAAAANGTPRAGQSDTSRASVGVGPSTPNAPPLDVHPGTYAALSASATLAPENDAPAPGASAMPTTNTAAPVPAPQLALVLPLVTALPLPADTTSAPPATSTAPAAPPVTSAQPGASTSASSAAPHAPAPVVARCGDVECAPGLVCCNASCGTCARPGEQCSQQVCGMSASPTSTPCGLNTCNVGEFCCNPYCGLCATSQAECDDSASCMSPVQYPQSVSCGMVTCNTGFVCCNPSCGICAPYGEPCSQERCG
jgi:hypothetical protein